MNGRHFPVGVETFEKQRSKEFVYVDKTKYIHNLVKSNGYYFLSRPRRFGKSLLLSTIKAFFEGRRELFEGLAITGYDHSWEIEDKRYAIPFASDPRTLFKIGISFSPQTRNIDR